MRILAEEKFEDIKEVIRNAMVKRKRISGQTIFDKYNTENLRIGNTKPAKSWDELVSFGRACSSSTSNTHHATVKGQYKVYDMDFGLDTTKTRLIGV